MSIFEFITHHFHQSSSFLFRDSLSVLLSLHGYRVIEKSNCHIMFYSIAIFFISHDSRAQHHLLVNDLEGLMQDPKIWSDASEMVLHHLMSGVYVFGVNMNTSIETDSQTPR